MRRLRSAIIWCIWAIQPVAWIIMSPVLIPMGWIIEGDELKSTLREEYRYWLDSRKYVD